MTAVKINKLIKGNIIPMILRVGDLPNDKF